MTELSLNDDTRQKNKQTYPQTALLGTVESKGSGAFTYLAVCSAPSLLIDPQILPALPMLYCRLICRSRLLTAFRRSYRAFCAPA